MKRIKSDIDGIKDVIVEKNKVLINWIGQAGFVFKTDNGTVLCIDPYYSNSIERYEGRPSRRMWNNVFKMEFFHPDYVICTHDHLDHTDPETIPLIAAYSDAVFYATKSSCQHMKRMGIVDDRIKTVECNKEYHLNDVHIKTVFAKHTEDSVGVILTISGIKIYLTGDTGIYEEMNELKKEKIDVLISCINGKYGNLNIDESFHLYHVTEADLLIPMHFDLIPDNTVDPEVFFTKADESKINTVILDVEKNYIIDKQEDKISISKQ